MYVPSEVRQDRIRTMNLVQTYLEEAEHALRNGSESNYRYFLRAAKDYLNTLESK